MAKIQRKDFIMKRKLYLLCILSLLCLMAIPASASQKNLSVKNLQKQQILPSKKQKKPEQKTLKTTGKKKVAIDAGHQTRANNGLEPIGPGYKTRKLKVTGVATGVPEYKFNLRVAKKLKKELISRGYEVYMIRTKNNVNISNKERAEKANKSGSDICIRIHADSNDNRNIKGASGLYPSLQNPFAIRQLSNSCLKLTNKILTAYCKETGIRNRGCVKRDDLTGTNWSKIPVALIECGFMSNPSEDRKLQKKSFQTKMAKGIADGIDAYFEN